MANSQMKKSTKIVLVVFVLSFIALQLYKFHWPTADLRVGDQVITVQVATTLYQQKKGLGGRDEIGKYGGMLFPFDAEARHAIVMRDMRFPIDIVWLKGKVIVDIANRVQIEQGATEGTLRRYYPRTAATAVLELPAGKAADYGLKIGDSVEHIR